MEKIEFENEVYYYEDGNLFNQYFMVVPKVESFKVLSDYFSKKDYTNFNQQELISYIKEVKRAEFYTRCIDAINFGVKKFPDSTDYLKLIFPMYTSCCRLSCQSQKAIDFWMENKKQYQQCLSIPLLTSLAAAYCDVLDFSTTKYCADKAYSMQGGGKGYESELSLVYKRIQKEAPDLFDD